MQSEPAAASEAGRIPITHILMTSPPPPLTTTTTTNGSQQVGYRLETLLLHVCGNIPCCQPSKPGRQAAATPNSSPTAAAAAAVVGAAWQQTL